MDIKEFRSKYPQYQDMSDSDLAESFYNKYYSDMPKDEFMSSFLGNKPEPTGSKLERAGQWLAEGAYDAIPAAAAMVGGVIGAASPVPGGAALGGAAGYYTGKQAQSLLHGEVRTPQQQIGDLTEAAAAEVGGKVISKGLETAGKVIKPLLGKTTGAGAGSIDYALEGGKDFTNAMRGKTTKDEIVQNFRDGMAAVKEQRAAAYRPQLEAIAQNQSPINISPIKRKLDMLKKVYGVKTELVPQESVVSTGLMDEFGRPIERLETTITPKTDYSRTAIGNKGTNDIKKIVKIVEDWGSKEGDTTAIGLDTLKRQLDDFYSDSSKARAFVASLRDEVKKTITSQVPQYAEMTKGYSNATKLINQLDKTLMLGKDKTADQVLRRIMSAGRENFEFRREMVEILGQKSGQNLMSQVAGYNMNPVLPRGLLGPISGLSMGAMSAFHPSFAPMLLAASPRTAGEFLNFYGKAMKESALLRPTVRRGLAAITVSNLGTGTKQPMQEHP